MTRLTRTRRSPALTSRRLWHAAILALVLIGGHGAYNASRAEDTAGAPTLSKADRQKLAAARVAGRTEIEIVAATAPPRTDAVVRELTALGASMLQADRELGYLRLRAPLPSVDRVAALPAIEALVVDPPYVIHAPSVGRSDPEREAPTPQASVSGAAGAMGCRAREANGTWSPLDCPYRPIDDLDARDLVSRHPTYDGRGVTIALIDSGHPDALLPEFQTAYALDGTPVPKFSGFINTADARHDALASARWVSMARRVSSRDRTVEIEGRTYRTPRDGWYRIGLFSERRLNSTLSEERNLAQDLDRNGNPPDDDGVFGVLWDEETETVWIDTNRTRDFSDDAPLGDYRRRPVQGVFGVDNPATELRESIGFALQIDRSAEAISINLATNEHATLTLGAVVGNRDPAGRVQGVAPGARILSVGMDGNTGFNDFIVGMIAAFRDPDVDLVATDFDPSVRNCAGPDVVDLILRRLMDAYPKVLFTPGGNGAGVGHVSCVVREGLVVGAYQSQASYASSYGFAPEPYDHLHWWGLSHGPGAGGSLKPDLLAPSGQVSTTTGFFRNEDVAFFATPDAVFPVGYRIDGGTSTASPMAAGAAALVVSAAKQERIPYTASTLKAALLASARHAPAIPALAQGHGLIQVGAALDLLRVFAKTPPVTITSRVPVDPRSRSRASSYDAPGIYEREGWSVGDRGERALTFRRTSGPAGPLPFTLRWRGNDGTFAIAGRADRADRIVLPLNVPVTVPIQISVTEPGAHAAVIALVDPTTSRDVYRTLVTVVAPLELRKEEGLSITASVKVPLPEDRSFFVRVPAETRALTISLKAGGLIVDATAYSPSGDPVAPCGIRPKVAPEWCTIEHPEPGVWEINAFTGRNLVLFDPKRPRPADGVLVTLDARLSATIDSGAISGTTISGWAVSGSAVSDSNGRASAERRAIRRGEQQVFEIDVPEDTALLSARVDDVDDARANLEIFLFNCPINAGQPDARTSYACARPRGRAHVSDATVAIDAPNPAAGRWFAVVDGYGAPRRGVRYRFTRVFTPRAIDRAK
jgi:Subtilase family